MTPSFWQDKSVVITGGSRGLGLVLARQLASQGARLTLLARDSAELRRGVSHLEAREGQVVAAQCDVASKLQVQRAIRKAVDQFGRVDVLINNAGIIQTGPLLNMSYQDFEASLAVHFWGALNTIFAVLPYFRQQGGGRIVNISSIGGRIAAPHLLPYTVGKFALAGLSEGLQVELARDKIHVTTVYPGLMRTGSPVNALFKGQYEKEFTWFSILDSLPIVSMDAERAASKILTACRQRRGQVVLSMPAKLGILVSALFPNTMLRALGVANRLLPMPATVQGNQARLGRTLRAKASRSVLTISSRRAAARNNEIKPPGTH